jgi:hypothetical protein
MTWYVSLRRRYRPDQIALLLIAESAPDPAGGDRRFFYAPTLATEDNLFRGVVLGLYGHRFPKGSADASKVEWLERLKADGVFLIDVVPHPVNHLSGPERRQARRDHATAAVKRAGKLKPTGIVVCHAPTFRLLRPLLHSSGLPLLHEEPIPFPLGNTRREFAEKLARCAYRVGVPSGHRLSVHRGR